MVYGKADAVSGILILKQAPLPEDILTLGAEGINKIWRDAKLRAVEMKRAQTLMAVAAKLIRVFYAMLTKGVDYDPKKMERPTAYLQAA